MFPICSIRTLDLSGAYSYYAYHASNVIWLKPNSVCSLPNSWLPTSLSHITFATVIFFCYWSLPIWSYHLESLLCSSVIVISVFLLWFKFLFFFSFLFFFLLYQLFFFISWRLITLQSEVSQKDKEHYSILTHIYGI